MGRRSQPELTVEAELTRRGVKFDIQKRVGRWTVDFFLPDLNTVLEVDGDYWHRLPKVAARDTRKNADLEVLGHRVCRVLEADVKQDVGAAVAPVLGVLF